MTFILRDFVWGALRVSQNVFILVILQWALRDLTLLCARKCHNAKNVLTHSPALDMFEERDSLKWKWRSFYVILFGVPHVSQNVFILVILQWALRDLALICARLF